MGLLGVAAAWLLLAAAPVLADNGPHVTNSSSAALDGSCGGCHRAHSGQGPNLVKSADGATLCLSCHGTGGVGATTNVVDGIQSAGTRGLKGGGFSYALMDTTWTGGPISRPSTSAHLYDSLTTGTIWGNGAIGSGAGKTGITMSCASCHDPHGNGNYRILRPIPTGSDAASEINVPDETTKTYTVASAQNRYFGEVYGEGDYLKQYALDEWCASCHTRYDAVDAGTGSTDSGDSIFKYRHMTRWPNSWVDCTVCHGDYDHAPDPFGVGAGIIMEPVSQNCHVAHGTAAQAGTFGGAVAWPDGSTTPSGNQRSSLLRLDGRGVCVGCHGRQG